MASVTTESSAAREEGQEFHKKVFMRVVASRWGSETLHAQYPSILEKLSNRYGNIEQYFSVCLKSEQEAYLFLEQEMLTLTTDEQRALSGFTRQEWFDFERSNR